MCAARKSSESGTPDSQGMLVKYTHLLYTVISYNCCTCVESLVLNIIIKLISVEYHMAL